MSDERAELQELIGKFRTGVLMTRGGDGHFHARPLAIQHQGPGGGLWFATSMDTQKIADLQADPHCAVSLYEGSASYVSLSGQAELVRDRALIHQLWRPDWKAWFPEGPDTEDLVLVHFHPEHAEYVHPTGGRLKVLFTMVRRAVTHERKEPDEKHVVELH